MLNAEIIAIGSEMLTPFRIDTNSLWLTERLNSIGVEVRLKTVVGDDEARLEETIRDAMRRSEIVISTGGLGPTEDDITRKIFARVLNRRLVLHDSILEKIRARFVQRGIPMPAINERQALIMEGATILENKNGTAPGMMLREGDSTIIVLPGPPREMRPMYSAMVEPQLRQRVGDVFILRRKLSIFGLTESGTDELASPIYTRYRNPTTTILFKDGQIELHLTAQARSEAAAQGLLDELAGKLEEVLGDVVFSRTDESMEQVVGERLEFRGETVATAESCTGGLLAGRLTAQPGSSRYFNEGVITYSNEAKTARLGVARELIESHGAVSEEVALAMARGIQERTGATYGLAITGIAGPGGGTEEKPVGLVYIALADDTAAMTVRRNFPGDRQFVRTLAVKTALDLLRRRIS
ncbi:MAG: competence/damage-inducible protein A [Acidobacteria bacterium]|nr:competence/damage-inducible protein A [Acidobacteriota bacterium]